MAGNKLNLVQQPPHSELIARLNDELRKEGRGGRVALTQGVYSLPSFDIRVLFRSLAEYDRFNPGNDPYGERDFGDIHVFGTDLFWKIDYYDLELEHGSPDPADSEVTIRVLTIMLKNEY